MNLDNKIKTICAKKNITIKFLAQEIMMSDVNLYRCLKRNSIETKNLEKIAEVLGVPVSYFFDEQINAQAGSDVTASIKGNALKSEIEELKTLLNSKEEIIDMLRKQLADKDEIIRLLKDHIKPSPPKNITNKVTPESVKS